MGMETLPQEAQDFLKNYPDTEVIELLVPDMNGIMRGKRIPALVKTVAEINDGGNTVFADGKTIACMLRRCSDRIPH